MSSFFKKTNNTSNTSNYMGVTDIRKLDVIIDIIDRCTKTGDDDEMYTFIEKNKMFFFKEIPVINNGTILHALSYGSDFFKKFDSILYNFSTKIDKIINYLSKHKLVFTKIVNLKPNPCEIKDIEGFTPYQIANIEKYDLNHKMKKLLLSQCNTSGGKRKNVRRTKRFRNKKKKTQKRFRL